MKKHILGLLFLSVAGTCLTSCGDDFLDTKNYSGVDVDNGLTDASSVSNAVNGEYDCFFYLLKYLVVTIICRTFASDNS